SASIISDTIILTAAHCMDHAYKSTADVSGLWVYFSNKVPSIDDVLPDNLLRKAVNGVVHPEWGDAIEKVNAGLNNINDIGILSFSGGLPQSFVPAKLVDSTTVLVAHQKITGAGFGFVSIWPREQVRGDDEDNFLKTSQLKWATFEITDPNFAEREFSANDPNKRQFVCVGDSGGPMYVQDSSGQLLLVGIIVRGTLIIKEFKEIMCGENIYQIFTKISAYLDWISSESKKLNDELSGS
ncbi:MAG: S1 family peptidase, partial [Bdellovibrio sp.]